MNLVAEAVIVLIVDSVVDLLFLDDEVVFQVDEVVDDEDEEVGKNI
jgi:hypothetical protein